jgi:class 3 adenylate cyclase/tetratricopeptide (TPR) repeat protein
MLGAMDERICSNCGAPLPADARFCPRCGTPTDRPLIGGPDEGGLGPIGEVAERKVVTVLFADLARSTELANSLDPERFREVMAAFYAMVQTELESLRGTAEKFSGDAVMALFGLPHAHEDDALRAVRAGLIIRDRTERLGRELGLPLPLEVHVGINSGPVATGTVPARGPGQSLVSGVAVNLAARLQQAAGPGEVLVGETTYQLTMNSVRFGEPRRVAARGFGEEMEAWPVEAISARSTRRTIPLVGRGRELALIRDTLERVVDTSRAHLVTLLGETGIGKTRLVQELSARAPEGTRILSGRTGEFEEDVTFAPVAEMVRQELALGQDARADDVRQRLHEVVDGCCEPSEGERVAATLGLVLGLGPEGETPPESERRSGDDRGPRRSRVAEVRAGFAAFADGLSRLGPLVLVFEDLHVARPELLDLVEGLLANVRRRPVLVVAVARDWFLEQRPEWGRGHPDALTLRLEPLSFDEACELARVAGESIDEATASRIAAHAGGNPFFIVETTGMMLQPHPEHEFGVAHSHLLPPTVQAVVAARLDHLPEPARDLARKASVFPAFRASELALIADVKPDALEALQDAELLTRDDRGEVWRFRHGVLRDVAYESLTKRERERLHLQVAEGLSQSKDRGRYRQSIAYHLEQAARAGLDLDPTDRTLADRAVEALTHAGDVARWRIESRTAIDLYERALDLAGPEDAWGPREARILSSIGEAAYWLGDFDRAASTLSRALRHGGDDAWTRAHASRFLADIELNVQGDHDRAEELFDRALEASRELEDPWAESRTLLMAGWVPYWRGDFESARRLFQRALDIARGHPERDLWAEARALTSLTSVISVTGDEVECLALAEEALGLGREMRDPFTVAVAQQSMGNSLRRMMRLDEALACLEDALRIFRDLDARWEVASALGDRGNVHRLLGRLPEAEADLRETLRISQQIGSLVPFNLARLVLILLARGQPREAERVLREIASLPSFEEWVQVDPPSHLNHLEAESMVAFATGDVETARAKAVQALEEARAAEAVNEFASRVVWTGRLFGAEVVGGQAALDEAEERLREAHWEQFLMEPDLFLAEAGQGAPTPADSAAEAG